MMKSIQEKDKTKLMEISDEADKKINLELSSMMKCALSKEIIPGERFASLPSEELVNIRATNLKIMENENFYRILFLATGKELAFIIPQGLSVAVAKTSLKDLKRLSRELKTSTPLTPFGGVEIYLEYEKLHTDHHWSLKDISEQITFDFLVALFILRDDDAEAEVKEFARKFMYAILEYLRMPKPNFSQFIKKANSFLDNEILPFEPIGGLIEGGTIQKLTEGREAWRKKEKCWINRPNITSNFLLNFWIMSNLKGYWHLVETHKDLEKYNNSHRNTLLKKLLTHLSTHFQEINNPKIYAPESINNFFAKLI